MIYAEKANWEVSVSTVGLTFFGRLPPTRDLQAADALPNRFARSSAPRRAVPDEREFAGPHRRLTCSVW